MENPLQKTKFVNHSIEKQIAKTEPFKKSQLPISTNFLIYKFLEISRYILKRKVQAHSYG